MKNLIKKIVKVYNENSATIVCGLMAMNGTSNTFSLYESLRK